MSLKPIQVPNLKTKRSLSIFNRKSIQYAIIEYISLNKNVKKATKERRNENRQKKQLRKEGTKTEAKLYFGWKWIIDVKSI